MHFRHYVLIGLIAFVGGGSIALMLNDNDNYKQKVDAFDKRCTDQGGLSVAVLKQGKPWLGCYTGLTEVENE